jgi:hypothetical protein
MTGDPSIYVESPAVITPEKLWWRRFFIRLGSWEYWPLFVFNIPTIFIWLWNAIKARDLFFVTLTNPGITSGGFFGASKASILSPIPETYKPRSILIAADTPSDRIANMLQESGISFPVIAKPEVGERGWLIAKVHAEEELIAYLSTHAINFMIQEYIDLPLELGVFVYMMPDGSEATVSSICEKHFLQIEGDGQSSIGQLIIRQDRAVLQYEKLRKQFEDRWNDILHPGEVLILEPIGNHCRGTMFLDRNDQIDEAIKDRMVELLKTMSGVYYGRFDLRTSSWEALRKGKDIRIMEFNGTNSDVSHIFQPGYSLLAAYRDIAFHWDIMHQIAKKNRHLGHKSLSFKEIIPALVIYFRYKRTNQ